MSDNIPSHGTTVCDFVWFVCHLLLCVYVPHTYLICALICMLPYIDIKSLNWCKVHVLSYYGVNILVLGMSTAFPQNNLEDWHAYRDSCSHANTVKN